MQNPLAVALLGDQTIYTGLSRSTAYRWFTDPADRRIYPEADHDRQARFYVSSIRAALSRDTDDLSARELVRRLQQESREFAELWRQHEVAVRISDRKRMVHPRIGTIELDCQTLVAENQAQVLLVYTATPGTEDYEKLQLLSVIGSQQFASDHAQVEECEEDARPCCPAASHPSLTSAPPPFRHY